MSVDPNNPLEITVDLSISDNDFVIVSDIEPVPDLSFFSEIRVFSDHFTGWIEPKSDNSHKLDLMFLNPPFGPHNAPTFTTSYPCDESFLITRLSLNNSFNK